jgi:hypothetical protein
MFLKQVDDISGFAKHRDFENLDACKEGIHAISIFSHEIMYSSIFILLCRSQRS